MSAKEKGGTTLLHKSAQRGYRKLVKILIAAGADVNAKDRNGKTPLHLSAERGYLKIVKLLIAAGADVNAYEGFGETPLFYSVHEGHRNIVKVLIDAGADVNATFKPFMYTPLHSSVQSQQLDIAIALIAAGADVNSKIDFGMTPLHLWAETGKTCFEKNCPKEFIDILKCLLRAGADVNIEDLMGRTPLDIVVDNTEMLICMVKHIILYVVASNKPLLKRDVYMVDEMWYICELQVKELKETYLGSSKVSLFEFLMETDENKTALYSSEESFGMNTIIDSYSYFEKFFLFTEDIISKFLEGSKRADLLFKNQTILKQHSVCKILPLEIVRKITEYLEVRDLKNVLRASAHILKGPNVICLQI